MYDLTVIIPNYNKAEYIQKALDSILEQKTKYSFEILIADDFSTDKTIEIVNEYKKNTTIPINLLLSNKNNGLFYNIFNAYENIKTQYFTVLDPDDYWCDNNKIEVALDYLETHKDFTIYLSNIYVKNGNNTSTYINSDKPCDFDFNDFLNNKALLGQTSGTFFRNIIFKNGVPEYLKTFNEKSKISSFRGDTFRNLIHLHEGKCHYDGKLRSVYQITEKGIWTTSDKIKQDLININIYKDFYLLYEKKYPQLLQKSYNLFYNLMNNLQKYILQNNISEEKISQYFDELKYLQILFCNNKEVIELPVNKTGFKQKIKRIIKRILGIK